MCPLCHGALSLLGKLGIRWWYRCRACGADWCSETPNADLYGDEVE